MASLRNPTHDALASEPADVAGPMNAIGECRSHPTERGCLIPSQCIGRRFEFVCLFSLVLAMRARAPFAQAKQNLAKKRRRPGGVPRAFVRVKSLGCKGRPDLAELARQYHDERSRQSRDYMRACAMAECAARLKKLGISRTGSTFGSNARAVRKRQLKDSQLALWHRTRHLGDEARLLSVSSHIVQQGLSLHESLAMARSAARFDSAKNRERGAAAMTALDGFRAGAGAQRVKALVAAIPQMKNLVLRPEPVGPCLVFSICAPDGEAISRATAWAHGAAKHTNLAMALEKDWEQLHRLVQLSECPPLPANLTSGETSACYKAGVCLCSNEGKIINGMAEAFVKQLKKAFAKADQKTLLEGGVVVRIAGEPDTEDLEELLAMERPCHEELYHIGLQYLKPYRPTFLRVSEVSGCGEEPVGDERVYVKADWNTTLAPIRVS